MMSAKQSIQKYGYLRELCMFRCVYKHCYICPHHKIWQDSGGGEANAPPTADRKDRPDETRPAETQEPTGEEPKDPECIFSWERAGTETTTAGERDLGGEDGASDRRQERVA
jgi:hypothetical protein